jgi:hypothetical protein
MWSKILTRFKHIKPNNADYENVICANCETHFSGHFCPNCGQALKEYDKPFGFILYNFLGDFFAFDMRFFRSLVALVFKPGYLSTEYIEGRRVKFTPPFRIFVFVSFLLFLLLQNYTNRGLTTVLDKNLAETGKTLDSILVVSADSMVDMVSEEMTEDELAFANSFFNGKGSSADTASAEEEVKLDFNLESFRDTKDIRHALEKLAIVLEEKLEKEEDPEKRAQLREQIQLCRSPEQANAKILKYMSWAFFLLLPLFALLLKFIYIRSKHNYMRHLIFSIHIHAFIYIVMTIIVALYLFVPGNLQTITSIIVCALPVYSIVAMKRFYKQSALKTTVKFFIITSFYNMFFLMVVTGAILNALNIA